MIKENTATPNSMIRELKMSSALLLGTKSPKPTVARVEKAKQTTAIILYGYNTVKDLRAELISFCDAVVEIVEAYEGVLLVSPIGLIVELPAKDEPKSTNEVADGEDNHDHSKDPKEVPKHDLPHDIVVVGELLAPESVILYDSF